jgi:ABC-type transporter Mla maintaining outer membrane lipid asymmetry ATPase subunit MlaF
VGGGELRVNHYLTDLNISKVSTSFMITYDDSFTKKIADQVRFVFESICPSQKDM